MVPKLLTDKLSPENSEVDLQISSIVGLITVQYRTLTDVAKIDESTRTRLIPAQNFYVSIIKLHLLRTVDIYDINMQRRYNL